MLQKWIIDIGGFRTVFILKDCLGRGPELQIFIAKDIEVQIYPTNHKPNWGRNYSCFAQDTRFAGFNHRDVPPVIYTLRAEIDEQLTYPRAHVYWAWVASKGDGDHAVSLRVFSFLV